MLKEKTITLFGIAMPDVDLQLMFSFCLHVGDLYQAVLVSLLISQADPAPSAEVHSGTRTSLLPALPAQVGEEQNQQIHGAGPMCCLLGRRDWTWPHGAGV